MPDTVKLKCKTKVYTVQLIQKPIIGCHDILYAALEKAAQASYRKLDMISHYGKSCSLIGSWSHVRSAVIEIA